jgi:rubrerythrin
MNNDMIRFIVLLLQSEDLRKQSDRIVQEVRATGGDPKRLAEELLALLDNGMKLDERFLGIQVFEEKKFKGITDLANQKFQDLSNDVAKRFGDIQAFEEKKFGEIKTFESQKFQDLSNELVKQSDRIISAIPTNGSTDVLKAIQDQAAVMIEEVRTSNDTDKFLEKVLALATNTDVFKASQEASHKLLGSIQELKKSVDELNAKINGISGAKAKAMLTSADDSSDSSGSSSSTEKKPTKK